MNQKIWVACAVLAIVPLNTGCTTCCHKSYAQAWKNGPECELPPDCRGNVYLFMVHGTTPTTGCGLEALREKLAEGGYAKVGIGEVVSAPLVACAIKDIAKCEPDARFVLLGYDFGGAAAVCLARDLSNKGIPIEAVVLLDPLACGDNCTAQTLLITSGQTTSTVPHTHRLIVPDANHFKLPAHPATVAAVTDLLRDVATRCYQPVGESLPTWNYPYAPAMRSIPKERGGEWDILAENGNPPHPIGTKVVSTPPTTTPQVPVSTSAGPVLIPK